MKKRIKAAVLMLICISLLCGCTESTIIFGNQSGEVPEVSSDGIAWAQLWSDLQDEFTDTNIYPFAGTVNGGFFEEDDMFKFYLLVNQEISKEEAAAYATEFLKGVGLLMANQNPQYTPPSDTSYGSYLDKYDIYVMVSQDDIKEDKDSWILEDTIKAGQYKEVGAAE